MQYRNEETARIVDHLRQRDDRWTVRNQDESLYADPGARYLVFRPDYAAIGEKLDAQISAAPLCSRRLADIPLAKVPQLLADALIGITQDDPWLPSTYLQCHRPFALVVLVTYLFIVYKLIF